MSKIPKAHTTATRPKSVSTFKPSTLNVKRASFNFAVNDATATATATKAPKLGMDIFIGWILEFDGNIILQDPDQLSCQLMKLHLVLVRTE